jgi:membrane-bound lytic murein transglycosylase MltF
MELAAPPNTAVNARRRRPAPFLLRPWATVCAAAAFAAVWALPASADTKNSPKTNLPQLAAWTGDFDGMQKRRLIRILVPYSKTIYFIDKGEQFGTAFEFGREFDKWLNQGKKKQTQHIVVAFIPTSRARLFEDLNAGRGDMVAANLTITPARLEAVDFTSPVASNVREVLVTGPSAPPIKGIEDLSGKELYVRESSSYHEHLVALNAALAKKQLAPIRLIPADEHLEDEDLLEMVNAGLLPYAVVDDHKAGIWSGIFLKTEVRKDLAINEGGEIAFAIRKNSPLLKQTIDQFLAQKKIASSFVPWLRKRYYTDDKMVRQAYAPEATQRFDNLVQFFRRYGDQYGFDHLMIAGQGFQESKLDQALRYQGAVGVMQLLPSTGKTMEVAGIDTSAERNIEAGNKYLRYLVTKYIDDPAVDAKNQTLFAFAAYNAGPGRLKQFRAKAKEMGLDPNVWFNNVEHGAAAIVGRITVQYVSNIYKYYIAYSLALREIENTKKAREKLVP